MTTLQQLYYKDSIDSSGIIEFILRMRTWISSKDNSFEEKNRVSSYRGYLYKMKRSQNLLAPQWGKRWFSVEGRFLKWYRQDSDVCHAGMVDLRHTKRIQKADPATGIAGHTFVVACQDRNLYLRASTNAEMTNWMKALHRQADIAKGGNGMHMVHEEDVDDHNYRPPSSGNKKGNSRQSISLSMELENNLKKLEELEREVKYRALNDLPKPLYTEMRHEEEKYDNEQDIDQLGEMLEFTRSSPSARGRGISKEKEKEIKRVDSESSIESIPLVTKISDRRSHIRLQRAISDDKSDTESDYNYTSNPRIRKQFSDSYDEFSDIEIRPEAIRRPATKKGTPLKVSEPKVLTTHSAPNAALGGKKSSFQRFTSADSADEFDYIPEIANHENNFHSPKLNSRRLIAKGKPLKAAWG